MISRSVLAADFLIDPETGVILHNPKKNTRGGQRRARAGWIKKGTAADGGGYRFISVRAVGRQKKVRAHHLIWFWARGEWPSGEIDHINGDRDDNRIANLRAATVAQNRMNRTRQSNNKSGFKWVYWDTQRNLWRAQIAIPKSMGRGGFYCGHYSAPEEAYAAACVIAEKIHGDFFRPS